MSLSKFYGYPFDAVENTLTEALDWVEDDAGAILSREEYNDVVDTLSEALNLVNDLVGRRIRAEEAK